MVLATPALFSGKQLYGSVLKWGIPMDTPFLLLFNRDNDDKLGGFRNTLDSDTSIVAQHKLFFNEARTGDWSLRRSNAPLGVSICTSPQRKYSTLGPKWLRVKTLVPWFSKQLVVMDVHPRSSAPKILKSPMNSWWHLVSQTAVPWYSDIFSMLSLVRSMIGQCQRPGLSKHYAALGS